MITDEQLAATIARLAINYNRTWEDEDAVGAVFDMWQAQLAATLPVDVDAAVAAILADVEVRFFPTIAEFRARVVKAAADRNRHAHNAADPDAEVKCIRCLDTGFVEAGVSDEGYWFVDQCTAGCKPPPSRRRRMRAFRSTKHRPGAQQGTLALMSAETLQAAVSDTKRMLGDHEEF
jgi:hypothetical protein